MSTSKFAAAALAGLLSAGVVSVSAAQASGVEKTSSTTMANEKHACKGMNACKGQGGCKAGDNGCAGKNSCKGHGGCATDGSKK